MIEQPEELSCSFEQTITNDFQSIGVTEQEDDLIKVNKNTKEQFFIISFEIIFNSNNINIPLNY